MEQSFYADTLNGPSTYTNYAYYPNGCLKGYGANLCDSAIAAIRVEYHKDSCNIASDTVLYPRYKMDPNPLIWDAATCQSVKNDEKVKMSNEESSYRFKIVKHSYLYSDLYIGSLEQQKRLALKDAFYGNLIFKGSTKNKKVWKGTFYFYADESVLYRVEKWRKGELKRITQ